MMDKKSLKKALEELSKEKGKRKFTQSVELIVNFRAIDFSKPENRLNLAIILPKGRGEKTPKVAVFADTQLGAEAKKAGADLIISPEEIESYKKKSKLRPLLREYTLLTQPNLMGQVARHLGKFLGRKGKMPKPILGDVKRAIENAKKSVYITSKGKYLPTAQAFIGTEKMSDEDLIANAEAVLEGIKKKVPQSNIKSVYLKYTMSKAVKV